MPQVSCLAESHLYSFHRPYTFATLKSHDAPMFVTLNLAPDNALAAGPVSVSLYAPAMSNGPAAQPSLPPWYWLPLVPVALWPNAYMNWPYRPPSPLGRKYPIELLARAIVPTVAPAAGVAYKGDARFSAWPRPLAPFTSKNTQFQNDGS